MSVATSSAVQCAASLRPAASRRAGRAQCVTVRASSQQSEAVTLALPRRELLAGAVGFTSMLALPVRAEYEIIPVEKLIKPFKEGMRAEIKALLIKTIQETEGLDYRKLVKLMFNDAATYDKATKTGGINGSIHFPEELKRPENKGLEGTVAILATIKAKVDAASTTDYPLSWADVITYAGRVKTKKAFQDIVRARAAPGQGDALISIGTNDFEFPQLCVKDADGPDPEGRVPGPGASVEEWKAKFAAMGLNKRDLSLIGPEVIGDSNEEGEAVLRQDPDLSKALDAIAMQKALLTRTPFEVPWGKAFIKVSAINAQIDPNAYLYPYKKEVLKLY